MLLRLLLLVKLACRAKHWQLIVSAAAPAGV
jgi:hypothetical protein